MDSLTMAAASGMRSRLESLDMLANNLANTSAPGFKADREFYNLYVSDDAAGGNGQTAVTAPVIEKRWTDFSQGSLTPTSNPLDLAITGQGFFAVTSPTGTLFTRDGSFRLSPQGQLQTQEGYAVRDPLGNPIVLDPAKSTDISTDGTLLQDGVEVGKVNLVDFSNPQSLTKQGQNYFFADNGITPIAASLGGSAARQAGERQLPARRVGGSVDHGDAPVRELAESDVDRNRYEQESRGRSGQGGLNR